MVSKVETNPRDVELGRLFDLLHQAFAYMGNRIDPPSSLTRMTLNDLAEKMEAEDIFIIRDGAILIACLFGTERQDVYYIGKLAVAQSHRGRGLARSLVEAAAARARELGRYTLELQSRVELVENHATFTRLGFVQTGQTTHPGYTRPTSLTFHRALSSPQDAGRL